MEQYKKTLIKLLEGNANLAGKFHIVDVDGENDECCSMCNDTNE